MVKNILILRFGNEFFGATWNRHHIDNVQVCNLYLSKELRLESDIFLTRWIDHIQGAIRNRR